MQQTTLIYKYVVAQVGTSTLVITFWSVYTSSSSLSTAKLYVLQTGAPEALLADVELAPPVVDNGAMVAFAPGRGGPYSEW